MIKNIAQRDVKDSNGGGSSRIKRYRIKDTPEGIWQALPIMITAQKNSKYKSQSFYIETDNFVDDNGTPHPSFRIIWYRPEPIHHYDFFPPDVDYVDFKYTDYNISYSEISLTLKMELRMVFDRIKNNQKVKET